MSVIKLPNEYGVGSMIFLHVFANPICRRDIVPVSGNPDGIGVPVGVNVGVVVGVGEGIKYPQLYRNTLFYIVLQPFHTHYYTVILI